MCATTLRLVARRRRRGVVLVADDALNRVRERPRRRWRRAGVRAVAFVPLPARHASTTVPELARGRVLRGRTVCHLVNERSHRYSSSSSSRVRVRVRGSGPLWRARGARVARHRSKAACRFSLYGPTERRARNRTADTLVPSLFSCLVHIHPLHALRSALLRSAPHRTAPPRETVPPPLADGPALLCTECTPVARLPLFFSSPPRREPPPSPRRRRRPSAAERKLMSGWRHLAATTGFESARRDASPRFAATFEIFLSLVVDFRRNANHSGI